MTQKTLLITITVFLLLLTGQVPTSARTAPAGPRSLDPILAAPLLGPRVQLSTESIPIPFSPNGSPAATYNSRHDEFLVVWGRNLDASTSVIYGRRVDGHGVPIGSGMVLLTTGPGSREGPSLVYNPTKDQYFLVYGYCNPCAAPAEYAIYGRILNYDLSGRTEFEIWKWTGRALERPHVAWSSLHDEYLVVWNAYDPASYQWTDVAGRRYAADGTPLQDYVVQYRSANHPGIVNLVYNPRVDEFLVTWEEGGVVTGMDIYAARVKWDNTIEQAAFPVQVAANDQFSPSVTLSPNTGYLVVWSQAFASSDLDIYGRELDVHGDPVGDLIPIDTTPENTCCPIASARPGDDVDTWVVWTQGQLSTTYSVAGRHWTDASSRVLWTIDSGNTPILLMDPVIATGFTGVLFAYSGMATDTEDYAQIYSRLWTGDMNYVPVLQK